MRTIAGMRDGLVDALKEISGLSPSPYIRDQMQPGSAVVARSDFDPRMVMGEGKSEYQFKIIVTAGAIAEKSSQMFLDELAETSGSRSILQAVQAQTYVDDDVWDYAEVTQISEVKVIASGGVEYLFMEFDVEVVA